MRKMNRVSFENITSFASSIYGSQRLGVLSVDQKLADLPEPGTPIKTMEKGNKHFELTNHLGNVLSVISDRIFSTQSTTLGKVARYPVDLVSSSDYFPGVYTERSRSGMQMPGRVMNAVEYRYGYQGSEKDDDAKGEGNSYTTFYRFLDVRIGRWLSIDPKISSRESQYVNMGNNPIINLNMLGDTKKRYLILYSTNNEEYKDTETFKSAAWKLRKEYKNPKYFYQNVINAVSFEVKNAKGIVYQVNNSSEEISRLDIISHSGLSSLFFPNSYSTDRKTRIKNEVVRDLDKNNIIKGTTETDVETNTQTFDDINWSRFSVDAVIEFHGCSSASVTWGSGEIHSSLAKEASKELYKAGKKYAVAIGHVNQSTPINDDYRNLAREVYHNGELLFTATEKGNIRKSKIKKAIDEKLNNSK